MLVSTISSALTPVTADYLWLIIIIRFISGSAIVNLELFLKMKVILITRLILPFKGMLYPTFQELIANWAPPQEKGKFLSGLLSSGIGTVIDWSLSGIIIERIGWHFAFYMVAIAMIVFAAAWYFTVFDSPSKHPRISETERKYILSHINTTVAKKRVHF